jgi:hypothetical protein
MHRQSTHVDERADERHSQEEGHNAANQHHPSDGSNTYDFVESSDDWPSIVAAASQPNIIGVLVAQDEKPIAAVLTPARLEALLEELEDLRDAVDALTARAQIEAGEVGVSDWEDFEAELNGLQDSHH